MLILSSITISLFIVVNSQHVGHVPIVINTWFVSNATKAGELTIPVLHTHVFPILIPVVSKSGNINPGPNSYFLYYIFIKALILITFEHNA